MTGDRDWSAPNHMLDRLNWRYQFDYEICDPVIQLIAISARTAILLRATPSVQSLLLVSDASANFLFDSLRHSHRRCADYFQSCRTSDRSRGPGLIRTDARWNRSCITAKKRWNGPRNIRTDLAIRPRTRYLAQPPAQSSVVYLWLEYKCYDRRAKRWIAALLYFAINELNIRET